MIEGPSISDTAYVVVAVNVKTSSAATNSTDIFLII
jgi:hypothetical protein